MAEGAAPNRASNSRLNWLRAAVLGANDGVVSVSSIILGVAGATSTKHTIFIAGLAGLVAGAFSMAIGEYVSVSSQRDTEEAYIKKEKKLLKDDPNHELDGLAAAYEAKGVSHKTSLLIAKELSAKDALAAHLEAELQLDANDLNSPTQAAIASMISFTIGGLVPLIAVVSASAHSRVSVTFIAVLVALTLTGFLSATAGKASRKRAILRVVIGGAAAMLLTYFVGNLFGAAVN